MCMREKERLSVVYVNRLLGAAHSKAGVNVHFSHANAIFKVFCTFLHHFTANKDIFATFYSK